MTGPTGPQVALGLLTQAFYAQSPSQALAESGPVAAELDAEEARLALRCSAVLAARLLDEVRLLGGDVDEVLQRSAMPIAQSAAEVAAQAPPGPSPAAERTAAEERFVAERERLAGAALTGPDCWAWAVRLFLLVAEGSSLSDSYRMAESALEELDDVGAREVALALATVPRFGLASPMAESVPALEELALLMAWAWADDEPETGAAS